MAAKRGKAAQRRREQIVEIVSSLPEVDVSGEQHLAFRIRKKTFGYYLDDHHGDGIVGLALKAAPGDANALAARHPSRYYLPDYLGPKGWLGLRTKFAQARPLECQSTLVFGCRRFGFEGDFVIVQSPPSPIHRQSSCLDQPCEF